MPSGARRLRCPRFAQPHRHRLDDGDGTLVAIRGGMDLVFLGVMAGFFTFTWGLAVLGERLAPGSKPGEEHSR